MKSETKIIIHNPHSVDMIGKPLFYLLNNRFAAKKFKYLAEYINKNPKKFIFYIDSSSIPRELPRIIPKRVEIFFWCILNWINPFKIKKIYTQKALSKIDNWVFFSFIFNNLNYKNATLPDFNGIKLAHLNHFFSNIKIVSDNLLTNKIDFFISENNLSKNSDYFKKYFNYYKKEVYILPYSYQRRFKIITPFHKRKNKCISTWNYVIINQNDKESYFKEFSDFFNTDTLHPIRKKIAENKDSLHSYIDCYNHYYNEWVKIIANKENIIKKIIKKIINNLKRYWNYYNVDIVKSMNNYKMFLVWEEQCWLPALAFVEWMACWCAYIGLDNNMYTDIWLVPWKHYIWYNGTIDDLVEKIKYYQSHENELEEIAMNGYNFITEKLNWHTVAENFFQDIERLHINYKNNWQKKEELLFSSSFRI